MAHLTAAYFKFFDELAKNNNKEWFDNNKKRYEQDVKLPFRELVQAVIDKLAKDFPDINRDAAKSIFRINRDIRFSKDKSPYKVHLGALLCKKGTKDKEDPGYYLHIGADDMMIGGGAYFVPKEALKNLRQEIYYNNKAFEKLLNDKAFKDTFGTITGEKNKIIEPDYKAFSAEQPLIMNKQFWFNRKLTRKEATTEGFDKVLYNYFKAGKKMNEFLSEAMKG
jgi:uncharacterized protein (TIGR02453 family)